MEQRTQAVSDSFKVSSYKIFCGLLKSKRNGIKTFKTLVKNHQTIKNIKNPSLQSKKAIIQARISKKNCTNEKNCKKDKDSPKTSHLHSKENEGTSSKSAVEKSTDVKNAGKVAFNEQLINCICQLVPHELRELILVKGRMLIGANNSPTDIVKNLLGDSPLILNSKPATLPPFTTWINPLRKNEVKLDHSPHIPMRGNCTGLWNNTLLMQPNYIKTFNMPLSGGNPISFQTHFRNYHFL